MSKRLSVAAALVDDDSKVFLERSVMKAIGAAHGDVVLLTQGGRHAVALAHLDESEEAGPLAGLGSDIPNGKFIRIRPIDDTVDEDMLGEKLFENYLQPYFAGAFRPVQQGNLFLVASRVGGQDVEFVVVETDPKPYCIVGPKTDIIYNGALIPRQDVL